MKQEKNMDPVYILVGVAIIAIIVAVAIYFHRDDDYSAAISSSVQQAKGECQKSQELAEIVRNEAIAARKRAQSDIDRLFGLVNDLNAQISSLKTEVDVLKVRQHSFDKKLIAKERTVNLNLRNETPLTVEFAPSQKQPLLERSGVKKRQPSQRN